MHIHTTVNLSSRNNQVTSAENILEGIEVYIGRAAPRIDSGAPTVYIRQGSIITHVHIFTTCTSTLNLWGGYIVHLNIIIDLLHTICLVIELNRNNKCTTMNSLTATIMLHFTSKNSTYSLSIVWSIGFKKGHYQVAVGSIESIFLLPLLKSSSPVYQIVMKRNMYYWQKKNPTKTSANY